MLMNVFLKSEQVSLGVSKSAAREKLGAALHSKGRQASYMCTGQDLREGAKNWFLPGRGLKNFLREGVGEGAYYINFFSSWGREGSKTGFWEGSPPPGGRCAATREGSKIFLSGGGIPPFPPRAHLWAGLHICLVCIFIHRIWK